MGETVRADALQCEAELVELAYDLGDRLVVGTNIGEDVAVLTGLEWYLAMFQRVEQHHLPACERPRHGQAFGKVEQDVPDLIDRAGQWRQRDHGR